MHETVVAQNIFETILSEAQKQNAKPVNANISCGLLNAVNDEVLRFAFEAIAKGSICEGMRLKIEHKPLRGRCRNCGEAFDVDFNHHGCLKCKSDSFDLLPDAPLVLDAIEFQSE